MTLIPSSQPVVKVKPRPDIYTLLLILAIISLAVAVFVAARNLSSEYGLDELGKFLKPWSKG